MKLLIYALSFAFFFGRVRPAKNVALGKQTIMSSIYANQPASAVTDGVLGQVGSTINDGNPWMVIDLVDEYYVSTVTLTNTDAQSYAHCQDYFIIGLTNNDPKVVPPLTSTDYDICAQYQSTVPVNATVSVTCKPIVKAVRYVVLRPKPPYDMLSVQEIEVNVATQRTINFKRMSGLRMMYEMLVPYMFMSDEISCMDWCSGKGCDSFNYRSSDGACEINTHPKGYNQSNVRSFSDWNWWIPSYSITEL